MTAMCSKMILSSLLFSATALESVHTGRSARTEPKIAEPAPKVEAPVSSGKASGLRDDADGESVQTFATPKSSAALFQALGEQLRNDPLVLTSSLLIIAYLVAQLFVRPKAAPKPVEKKKAGPGKSAFCVSVNQKLMHLPTWEEVLDCALAYQARTDVVNVVTAVHRSTKLALSHGSTKKLLKDDRLQPLLDQLQAFLGQDMSVAVRTRAVGNTSWALAKLNYRDEEGKDSLLAVLASNFVQYAQDFKPEELMNTVWAFAELSRDARENEERALKVAKAAVSCANKFGEFTLQQVVYFSWALARLSTVSLVRADAEVVTGLLAFKKLIVERATPEVHTLTTKNLAMVSWATAHLHKVRPDSTVRVAVLLQAVADHATKRGLRSFAAGELASIVWALSKCQVPANQFYESFKTHLVQNGLVGFSSQDLANVVCAFVNAEAGDDELYRVLSEACSKNKSFNKLEKTMVNWAFSQLTHIAAPKLQ